LPRPVLPITPTRYLIAMIKKLLRNLVLNLKTIFGSCLKK